VTCSKCNTEKKPTAMLLGTTPGWACECSWGTLSKSEFRVMFGRGFKRVKLPNVASGGAYSGSARQRRIARRVTLRQLREARNAETFS
jgi:hypothetical protein